MNKFLKSLLLGMVASFLVVGSAMAFPIEAGDTVYMDANWGDNYGIKTANGTIYNTFCLEAQITFDNDTPYFVESVGFVAVSGGNTTTFENIESISATDGSSFTQTGDPVSEETIWLYAAYFDGLFNTIATGQTLINKVQNAIWFSEEEVAGGTVGELDYNLLTALANSDFKVTGWDIQVVNIVGGPDKDHQSQLVGAPVPEPATMMLFGMGLLGLAGITRKRTKA